MILIIGLFVSMNGKYCSFTKLFFMARKAIVYVTIIVIDLCENVDLIFAVTGCYMIEDSQAPCLSHYPSYIELRPK